MNGPRLTPLASGVDRFVRNDDSPPPSDSKVAEAVDRALAALEIGRVSGLEEAARKPEAGLGRALRAFLESVTGYWMGEPTEAIPSIAELRRAHGDAAGNLDPSSDFTLERGLQALLTIHRAIEADPELKSVIPAAHLRALERRWLVSSPLDESGDLASIREKAWRFARRGDAPAMERALDLFQRRAAQDLVLFDVKDIEAVGYERGAVTELLKARWYAERGMWGLMKEHIDLAEKFEERSGCNLDTKSRLRETYAAAVAPLLRAARTASEEGDVKLADQLLTEVTVCISRSGRKDVRGSEIASIKRAAREKALGPMRRNALEAASAPHRFDEFKTELARLEELAREIGIPPDHPEVRTFCREACEAILRASREFPGRTSPWRPASTRSLEYGLVGTCGLSGAERQILEARLEIAERLARASGFQGFASARRVLEESAGLVPSADVRVELEQVGTDPLGVGRQRYPGDGGAPQVGSTGTQQDGSCAGDVLKLITV